MVSTRGKKVNHTTVDGEDAEEAPMRGTKRRRVSKADDESFQVEKGSPVRKSAAKPKGKGRKSAGRLEGLMKMPVDIFVEVCRYIEPMGLLNLARTSHRLRDILMSCASKAIWKESRSLIADLPECPADLSEPQYASFMFDTGCQGCGARTRKPQFDLHLRMCPHCLDEHVTSRFELETRVPFYEDDKHTVIPHDNAANSPRYGRNTMVYPRKLTDEYEAILRPYLSMDYRTNVNLSGEAEEALKTLRTKCNSWIQSSSQMRSFTWRRQDAKYREDAVTREAREADIVQRLEDIGYPEDEIPIDTPQWQVLVRKPAKLTDAAWQRLLPKIEPLLEERRAFIQYTARIENFITFYLNYVKAQVTSNPDLVQGMFIPVAELGTTCSAVDDLLQELTTVDVTQEHFDNVLEAILSDTERYRNRCKTSLWNKLRDSGYGNEGSGTPEEVDATLRRVDSIFHCRTCDRWVRYPHIMDHRCCYVREVEGDNDEHPILVPFSGFSSRCLMDSSGQTIVRKMLEDLGMAPDTAMANLEALGKHLICGRCPSGHVDLMDIHELLGHYASWGAWYAAWDAITSEFGRRAFLHWPEDREDLPDALQLHDHLDERPIVKHLSNEEEEKHHVAVEAFRERSRQLSEELDEQEGPNDIVIKTRLCCLCPISPYLEVMGPAAMEAHIQHVHNETPDVRNKSVRAPPLNTEPVDWNVQ